MIGILHFFLGIQALPLLDGLFISQSKYVLDLLTCFKMDDCNACANPFQQGVKLTKDCQSSKVDATLYFWLVDSLIYLTRSQPNISFGISVVSCLMQDPRESRWKAAKHIVCYLKHTSQFGIKYSQRLDSLVNYTESNQVGDGDDKKYTFGFVFHFSPRPLVWSSKKQKGISLSTMEAKYHGAVNVDTKAVQIQQLLGEIRFSVEGTTIIHYENKTIIQVADNPIAHSKMKHIKLHCHYL